MLGKPSAAIIQGGDIGFSGAQSGMFTSTKNLLKLMARQKFGDKLKFNIEEIGLGRTVSAEIANTGKGLDKAVEKLQNYVEKLNDLKITLLDIDKELHGDAVKDEIGERSNPTASDGNSLGWRALGNTYGPTDEHKGLLSRVQKQLKKVKEKLAPIVNSTLPRLGNDLRKTGAPWVEGQGLINN